VKWLKNNLIKLFLVFLVWFLFFSLGNKNSQSKDIKSRIADLETKIEGEKSKNLELMKQIEIAQTDAYAERLAREKFGLQKPGEKIFFLQPEAAVDKTASELPNWRKWFFYLFNLRD